MFPVNCCSRMMLQLCSTVFLTQLLVYNVTVWSGDSDCQLADGGRPKKRKS